MWGTLYSKSYVRHLFNINEILGLRIASTLNLVFYLDLMKEIKRQINNDTFLSWSNTTLDSMKNYKGM